MDDMTPVTAIMNGAGFRGYEAYGSYAEKHPERLKFVAVAEPDLGRRKLFQKSHDIPDELAFSSWDELMAESRSKMADAAFICTPDSMHYKPAIRALNLGYHLVLEKPISPNIAECQQIAQTSLEKCRIVQVCHVLRFTEFWKTVKEVVDSGRIGKIIHYDHSENVSYWHFGHSYVRGQYRNKATSSPMILAKSSHDLDLMYWIIGNKPVSVQSTGELSYYNPENAPPGASERCTDGCPEAENCPWYAPRLYINAEPILRIGLHAPSKAIRFLARTAVNHRSLLKFLSVFDKRLKEIINWNRFPASSLSTDLSLEGKMKALREGPYGKCIYKCGNDVVDHQVSTFNFHKGITGTLTVHGLSELEGRELRIFGTKGVVRGYFRYNAEWVTVTDFRYSKQEVLYKAGLSLEGHGGGDAGLMDSFIKVVRGEANPEEAGTADVAGALESHYMAFAAEEARISQKQQELKKYR